MSFFAHPPPGPRLFCFPNAGGGTADFRRWTLSWSVVPATLPGREARLRERPYRNIAPLVEDLADALPTNAPFAFYGHSMGSWIAFELARELRRRGARMPEQLIVGARHAPQVPTRTPPLGRLGRDAFLDGMQQRYGAIPEALRRSPALLDAFLPALRADVVLLDDYRYTDEPPLDLPIHAFHATDDATLTGSEVDAWSQQTTGPFALHTTTGGHFFLREPHVPPLVDALLS